MRLPGSVPRGAIVTASVAGVLGVAGVVVAALHSSSPSPSAGGSAGAPGASPPAQVQLVGLQHGRVPWNRHVTFTVTGGKLRTVAVRADGSFTIDGTLSADDTTWTSAETLTPLAHYTASITYVDGADHAKSTVISFAAADAAKHLKATLSPGDGNTVGIGSPVVATFSRPVPESDRGLIEARLSVTTTPSVIGAWHWMNPQEVHWRPPQYWKRGTRVTVAADLTRLYLGGGVWGSGKHVTSFRIGNAHISRVNVAAHEMYVYNNGVLVRTMPISAGRDKYPTKSGVHITFEKSQVVTMDSATVGIPRNSPDGYYEKVYWDVRISYGGAFVHAAPWSVGDQGRVNVSHGCVNISPANAIWFYNFSQRGDIVDVYNSLAAPDTSDPGMADWNMSWADWVAGDAAPSAAAQDLHPKLPRMYEPGEPGYSSSSTSTTHRASPKPSASSTASGH